MESKQHAALFTAIDHPAIACNDVRKLTQWYCDVLGMRVIGDNGKTPPALVIGYDHNTHGGAVLEMMPVRDEGPEPREVPRFCKGLRHFALRVDDFDAAYEHLRKAGVEFLGEAGQAVGGGPIISFRDPEGNELQIVQR